MKGKPVFGHAWMLAVMNAKGASPGVVKVAFALMTFADYGDGTDAHPGNTKLRQMTGMSARTVERSLAWLRDNGFAAEVSHGGGPDRQASVWRLLTPAILDGVSSDEELPPSASELPPSASELPPFSGLTPAIGRAQSVAHLPTTPANTPATAPAKAAGQSKNAVQTGRGATSISGTTDAKGKQMGHLTLVEQAAEEREFPDKYADLAAGFKIVNGHKFTDWPAPSTLAIAIGRTIESMDENPTRATGMLQKQAAIYNGDQVPVLHWLADALLFTCGSDEATG